MTEKTTEDRPNIALMTAVELAAHIKDVEQTHRARLKTLRALQRARAAEEAAE
jgi:hypothetical protein